MSERKYSEIDDQALVAACRPHGSSLRAVREYYPQAELVIRYSDAAPCIEVASKVKGMPRVYGYVTPEAREIVEARQKIFKETWGR